jgi:hypothetical protein
MCKKVSPPTKACNVAHAVSGCCRRCRLRRGLARAARDWRRGWCVQDAKEERGYNALLVAAALGQSAVAEALLLAGADASVRCERCHLIICE